MPHIKLEDMNINV